MENPVIDGFDGRSNKLSGNLWKSYATAYSTYKHLGNVVQFFGVDILFFDDLCNFYRRSTVVTETSNNKTSSLV